MTQTKQAIIALCLMLSSCNSTPAIASNLDHDQVTKAIMGEAGGQDYSEKLAIACAIRNRGTLRGVYGLNSKTSYPPEVWQESGKAWAESEYHDVTGGASHWLSNWDLEHSRASLIAWRYTMKETLRTENFTFYKAK